MKTTLNTANKEVMDALLSAKVPVNQIANFEPSLLEKLVKDNPQPFDLRKAIFELSFDIYLSREFEGNPMAMSLANFFREDYPELIYMHKNSSETITLIKNQVAEAEGKSDINAFTEFIKENFMFSKFRKLKELVSEELLEVPLNTLSISFDEFVMTMFVQKEQQLEKIFTDCGFDYAYRGGDGTYDNKEEVQLDGELRILINEVYNDIKH
jgi:hypothetical protein